MNDNKNERVTRMKSRFSDRNSGELQASPPPVDSQPEPAEEKKTNRKRRTFYIDKDLITRIDQTFPQFNYEITPTVLEKSDFLELLLEYGLENLEALKKIAKNKK